MNTLHLFGVCAVLSAGLFAAQTARADHRVYGELVRTAALYQADVRTLMVEARLQFRGSPELDPFLACLTGTSGTTLELQRAAARRCPPEELALLVQRLEAEHCDLDEHLHSIALVRHGNHYHRLDTTNAHLLLSSMSRKLNYLRAGIEDLLPPDFHDHHHHHGSAFSSPILGDPRHDHDDHELLRGSPLRREPRGFSIGSRAFRLLLNP